MFERKPFRMGKEMKVCLHYRKANKNEEHLKKIMVGSDKMFPFAGQKAKKNQLRTVSFREVEDCCLWVWLRSFSSKNWNKN